MSQYSFYSNKLPIVGEVVMIKIDNIDSESLVISCHTLDYIDHLTKQPLFGYICKADGGRSASKIYKCLKIDKIIPVRVIDIDIKNGISFHFCNLTADFISINDNIHKSITKITNAFINIAYSLYITSNTTLQSIDRTEILNSVECQLFTQQILDNTLCNYTKHELISIFTNIKQLYIDISNNSVFPFCNNTAFISLLKKYFPIPPHHLELFLTISTTACSGLSILNDFSKWIVPFVLTYPHITTSLPSNEQPKFELISAPIYKLTITTTNELFDNTEFISFLKSNLQSYANIDMLHINININT